MNNKIEKILMFIMWLPLAMLYIAAVVSGVYQTIMLIARSAGISTIVMWVVLAIVCTLGIGYILYGLLKDIKDA